MANLLQITPFMWVEDVPAATRFFVEILGFKALSDTPYYAYLERESVAIRVCKTSHEPGCARPPGTGAYRYYIDVADVRAVMDEVRPKLLAAGLPGGDGPFDREYGKREFTVLAPDGDLVVFGESIP